MERVLVFKALKFFLKDSDAGTVEAPLLMDESSGTTLGLGLADVIILEWPALLLFCHEIQSQGR